MSSPARSSPPPPQGPWEEPLLSPRGTASHLLLPQKMRNAEGVGGYGGAAFPTSPLHGEGAESFGRCPHTMPRVLPGGGTHQGSLHRPPPAIFLEGEVTGTGNFPPTPVQRGGSSEEGGVSVCPPPPGGIHGDGYLPAWWVPPPPRWVCRSCVHRDLEEEEGEGLAKGWGVVFPLRGWFYWCPPPTPPNGSHLGGVWNLCRSRGRYRWPGRCGVRPSSCCRHRSCWRAGNR